MISSVILILSGCVSQKKFKAQVSKYDSLKKDYDKVDLMLSDCASEREKQSSKIKTLEEDLAYAKKE